MVIYYPVAVLVVPPGHLRSPVSLVQTAVMMSVASLGFISTVVGFYMSYCNDCVMYPGATDLPPITSLFIAIFLPMLCSAVRLNGHCFLIRS